MPKIKPKRIAIVGSRRRNTANDHVALCAAFDKIYNRGDIIVSGGCSRGADNMAESIARVRQIPIMIWYANWDGPDGKAAGFVRNTDIVEDCDIVLAMVAPDRTGGTEDTVKKAIARGKKVVLV